LIRRNLVKVVSDELVAAMMTANYDRADERFWYTPSLKNVTPKIKELRQLL